MSSDATQGAFNKLSDGSYFELQLQDGVKIPKDAQNINIEVQESNIWWTTPTIIYYRCK